MTSHTAIGGTDGASAINRPSSSDRLKIRSLLASPFCTVPWPSASMRSAMASTLPPTSGTSVRSVSAPAASETP